MNLKTKIINKKSRFLGIETNRIDIYLIKLYLVLLIIYAFLLFSGLDYLNISYNIFALNQYALAFAILMGLIFSVRSIFYNKKIKEKIALFTLFLFSTLIFVVFFLILGFLSDVIMCINRDSGCGLGLVTYIIYLVFIFIFIVFLALLLGIPIIIMKLKPKKKK